MITDYEKARLELYDQAVEKIHVKLAEMIAEADIISDAMKTKEGLYKKSLDAKFITGKMIALTNAWELLEPAMRTTEEQE